MALGDGVVGAGVGISQLWSGPEVHFATSGQSHTFNRYICMVREHSPGTVPTGCFKLQEEQETK